MKISIIIPVYNSEKHLKKCLDSLLHQTFNMTKVEVIIINDGSTDNSENIIFEYKDKLNCTYIKQKNKGQSNARNRGIEIAKGDYITFVDSDDYINFNMLETLYKNAIEDNLDIVTCDLAKIKNGNISHIKDRMSSDEIKNFILTKTGPCNMLLKMKTVKKYQFKFPTELSKYEDIAVIPILGLKNKIRIKHIDEPMYYYNDNDGSVMNNISYTKKMNDIFIAMDELLSNAQNEKNYELYKEEIEYLFIRHLIMSAGLRYARFDDPENKIREIKHYIESKFPNWKKNTYYKKSSKKYKITALLVMHNMKKTIKIIDKIRGKK